MCVCESGSEGRCNTAVLQCLYTTPHNGTIQCSTSLRLKDIRFSPFEGEQKGEHKGQVVEDFVGDFGGGECVCADK